MRANRGDQTIRLRSAGGTSGLIAAHVVEIIGPIRQEVLSGVRDPVQVERLEAHLAVFVDLPLVAEDYVTGA